MQIDALKRAVECSIWFDDTIFDRKTLTKIAVLEIQLNQLNSSEWLFYECGFKMVQRSQWHEIRKDLKRFFTLKFEEMRRPWHIISPFVLEPRYRWTDDYLWAQLDFISVNSNCSRDKFHRTCAWKCSRPMKICALYITLIFPWNEKGSIIANSIFAHSKHDRLWTWLHEIDNCFMLWSILR